MFTLFKKDLLVSAKTIFLFLVLAFFLGTKGFMLDDYFVAQFIYITTVILSVVGVLTFIATEDDKHGTDMMFNSLPLNRKTIVLSKYLSMAIMPFLYGISVYISARLYNISESLLFMFSPKNLFAFKLTLFSMAVSLISLSFYLPIYYISMQKAKMLGSAGMAIVFLIPVAMLRLTENFAGLSNANLYMESLTFNLMLLVISIILYLLSLQLSISIYNKKEF